jgi:hypothetical protein
MSDEPRTIVRLPAREVLANDFARHVVAHELLSLWTVSKPRQVLPGQFYLITRRCAQRQLLLRPYRDARRRWLARSAALFRRGTYWVARFAAVPIEAVPA